VGGRKFLHEKDRDSSSLKVREEEGEEKRCTPHAQV
jgi:hypothetical protein